MSDFFEGTKTAVERTDLANGQSPARASMPPASEPAIIEPRAQPRQDVSVQPTDARFASDLTLMAAVAAGAASAQHDLVVRLAPRARAIARSFLGDSPDVEDGLQLGLLEVLRSAASYRGECPVENWADRIVARHVARLSNERKHRRQQVDPDVEPEELPDADAVQRRFADDLPRALASYLDQLPEALRVAVVMRHSLGFSLEEIATQTSTSPRQVKKRLLRGFAFLRRMIRRDRVLGLHVRRGDT